ncbi:MAG: type I-D CRISPR-associated protein Cas7/Csc2 [Thermoplasmata archaeon]
MATGQENVKKVDDVLNAEPLKKLLPYFVDKIPLYRTAKTIQILLLRQTHDFTIFRTEDTRELNLASIPKNKTDATSTLRVAMLASKQKAPETRWYSTLLKTLAEDTKYALSDEPKTCELKDKLCQMCPRCVLFGAVSTAAGRGERYNIKHRIEYSTAFSIEEYEDIVETITFNAVNTVNQSTEQALGMTENIAPVTNFPCVITLNSVTAYEFIAVLRAILSCKSYGAETRVKGDMVNNLVGIAAGYEEVITSLEFNLEAGKEILEKPLEKTESILNEYKKHAMFPEKVVVLTKDEIRNLGEEILPHIAMNMDFVSKLYKSAEEYHNELAMWK